jgi:hypothetical protein
MGSTCAGQTGGGSRRRIREAGRMMSLRALIGSASNGSRSRARREKAAAPACGYVLGDRVTRIGIAVGTAQSKRPERVPFGPSKLLPGTVRSRVGIREI